MPSTTAHGWQYVDGADALTDYPAEMQALANKLEASDLHKLKGLIIAGSVASGGGISSGSGFTVTKTGTGAYTINFTVAFPSVPGFGFIDGPGAPAIMGGSLLVALAAGSAQVSIRNSGNSPVDNAFAFIAAVSI